MGLAFKSASDPGTGQTHVMVIGIGSYDYMRPQGSATPTVLGGDLKVAVMTQLTSPQASAEAFAKWVLERDSKQEWTKPLGSMRVLIGSGGFPDQNGGVVGDRARIADITREVRAWRDDLDKHKDNVGIFYFCGHGEMQQGQNFALAQDFGDRSGTFWENAINLSKLVERMRGVPCENQVYFIDACRVTSDIWADLAPQDARPLVNQTPPILSTQPPVLFAERPDRQAQGDEGQVSRFTTVLLETLNGYVATRRGMTKPWAATQRSIMEGVREVGNHLLGQDAITPEGSATQTVPIFFTPNPKVFALLSGDPSTLISNQGCHVTCPDQNKLFFQHEAIPIGFKTTQGDHSFDFDNRSHQEPAFPPIMEVDLK